MFNRFVKSIKVMQDKKKEEIKKDLEVVDNETNLENVEKNDDLNCEDHNVTADDNQNNTEENKDISLEIIEKDKKIEELTAKFEELNDKYLRLYSEYDNFRKRTIKEKMELIQFGGADIIKSLLIVMDDLNRGKKAMDETDDINAIKEGFRLIVSKFNDFLLQKGVEEIKSVGEEFNTDYHEAIAQQEVEEEKKGKVLEEVEKGYIYNGKVLRHAKVIVGN